MLIRGRSGYRPFESRFTPDEFNAQIGITPEGVQAMLAGSMFGWDCPAANPQPTNQ